MINYLALDTNILLLDAKNLIALGQDNIIVLSETVLEEIDSKKGEIGEIGYNAREFSRILASADIKSMTRQSEFHEVKMDIDGVSVVVISDCRYVLDTAKDSRNDQKIIQATQMYERHIGEKVVLMSNDTMVRLRGLSVGLQVTEFKVIDDDSFEFVKDLVISDPEIFRTIHYRNIMDIDPDYKPENFSYTLRCESTGQVKISTINNGIINVLGKDGERDLRKQNINPCNTEQLLMSKAIQDSTIDLVVVEASAGSGKTLVALSNAMKLMDLNKDKYDSIIYMRNTVDDYGATDEEVGYLSGNDEKFSVYLGPLTDSLDFMVRDKYKAKKIKGSDLEDMVSEGIDSLRERYNIQEKVALGQRGRTYSNSIIIYDEVQNMGQATMQKLLSRTGKNCKVIMVGSNRQIDSRFLTKFNNGMAVILDYCKNPKFQIDVGIFAINLKKTVRSPMADLAERLFE